METPVYKFAATLFLTFMLCGCQTTHTSTQATSSSHNDGNMLSEKLTEELGVKRTIDSDILKETRELLIHLPEDYYEEQAIYPVIYVLDGSRHFQNAVLSTELLHESGKMPKSIVIGLPNNTGQRARDAYSKVDNFLGFIGQEVQPFIEGQYRTSGRNVLFGHSAMGMVTLKEFASKSSKFDHFIASSSAIDGTEKALFEQMTKSASRKVSEAKTLYFSAGHERREGAGFVKGARKLSEVFSENANKQINWSYQQFAQHNHTSVAHLSLFDGLSFSFQDFEGPALTNFQDLESYGGIDALQRFFRQRSIKYHVDETIPELTITSLAFSFYAEGKLDEAIELLYQNQDNYAEATSINGALGFIHEHRKEMQKALFAYQNALATVKDEAMKKYYSAKVLELKKL